MKYITAKSLLDMYGYKSPSHSLKSNPILGLFKILIGHSLTNDFQPVNVNSQPVNHKINSAILRSKHETF